MFNIYYAIKCQQGFCSLHLFETSFFSIQVLYPRRCVFGSIETTGCYQLRLAVKLCFIFLRVGVRNIFYNQEAEHF